MANADFSYINSTYGVSAHKGARVEYTGGKQPEFGTIVGVSGPHLMIKLDGRKHAAPFHPDWKLRYVAPEETNVGGPQ